MASCSMRSYWSQEFIILFVHIIFIAVPTSSGTSSYSVDNNHSSQSEVYLNKMVRFENLNEPYNERRYGKLNIEVDEVTPTSIHIKWGLTNLTFMDSYVESTVFCELPNAKIVSDKLHATTDSFRFEFLSSNTKYIVCVHLLEKSKSTNTSILHYGCEEFSTIPFIRSDSIIGILLTVGYLALMGALGCATWYRRISKKKVSLEEEKLQIEDKYDEYYRSSKGGLTNYASQSGADNDALNGSAVFKAKSSRADCSGACVGFSAKEEDEIVEYDPKKREISF